jgi:metal-responsive CopG/Arc/MetJ family transcriptional regulator
MIHIRRCFMHIETVRINVTLPRELIETVNKIAGPRTRSHLISESIREYIRKIKKDELEKHLEEGYRVAAKESIAFAEEFEAGDLEGWDEY